MTAEATVRSTSTSSIRRTIAIATFLVAVGLPIAAILTAGARDVEVDPGMVDWIFVGIVALVTIAAFTTLVPWALRNPGIGARASVVAVSGGTLAFLLSLVAFWTMIPMILGAASALIGFESLPTVTSRGRKAMSTTGLVLGSLAVIGSIIAYIATS